MIEDRFESAPAQAQRMLDALIFDFEVRKGQYRARLHERVEEQIRAGNEEALRVVHSLTPLQSAVLRVMAGSCARPGCSTESKRRAAAP